MPPSSASAGSTQDFLSSFDLLAHSCSLLSLQDLLALATVSRFMRSVAESEQVWRPRLVQATRSRHSKPTDAADNSSGEQETACGEGEDSGGGVEDDSMTVCTCSQHRPTDPSASCKLQYLFQFQCVYSSQSGCHRLVQPSPLLLVNRGPRGSMVAVMRARRNSGHSATVSAGELHCVQSICQQCMASLALACKDFYDIRSEWAGSFTMTPLSIVPVPRALVEEPMSDALQAVDVRYLHVGGYEDIDHRRFVFEWRGASPTAATHPSTTEPSADSSSQQPPQASPVKEREVEEKNSLLSLAQSVTAGVRSAADTVVRAVSSSASPAPAAVPTTPPSAWHVVSMAPFCSGKWTFHSPANVQVTDALRHSRLPRTQQPRQRGQHARVVGPFAAVVPLRRARDGRPPA